MDHEIRDVSPTYRLALQQNTEPFGLAACQSWLSGSKSLLLSYFIGAEGGWVFVVPPDGQPKLLSLEVDESQAVSLGVTPGPLTAERLNAILKSMRGPSRLFAGRSARDRQTFWSSKPRRKSSTYSISDRRWSMAPQPPHCFT
jgi:hypothetical protein